MDPTVAAAMSAALVRLQEVGNLGQSDAGQNTGRLSSMMGVRAAQSNPIEANSISTLQNASGTNNAAMQALVAALGNTAASTPNPYTFVPQAATPAAQNR
jgi:hypothetical protein